MPYLSRILIYPVKSLNGVSLDSVDVLPSGALADDRRFGIFDEFGHSVNGKKNPRVHLLRSSFDPCCQTISFCSAEDATPNQTFHVDEDRAVLESWLSRFFGYAVTFRENTAVGFPDDSESPGPTIISVSTLREVAKWFDLTIDQTRARFRTNLEIDGVPPFWEDHLFGLRGTIVRFNIGGVTFNGINPCQRCIVPARDQSTGAAIPDFARRFVEMRRKHFPEWAEPSRFNHYYRLAVNTRIADPFTVGTLTIGQPLTIHGVIGIPEAPAPAPSKSKRFSGKLKLDRKEVNTPTVTTFRLTALDGERLPFSHLPGQFLNIELNVDGIIQRRCYTIASSPTRSAYCEITVKREENGTVSRFLHDHLQEGAEIVVSGPGGKFTFQEDDSESITLVAAGVGITPIMSKLRYLTDKKWPGDIQVIFCARTEQDIIFRDELRTIANTYPNVHVTITLTRPENSDWDGSRGRITRAHLRAALPTVEDRQVHICGPVEMAKEVTEMLKELGVPHTHIQSEAFGLPSSAIAASSLSDSSARIVGTATFVESGKSDTIREDQTVLELASKLGLAIDRGCMEGICGRCKLRLLSGNVIMAVDEALSAEEIQNGYILSCQAKPLGSIAVDA